MLRTPCLVLLTAGVGLAAASPAAGQASLSPEQLRKIKAATVYIRVSLAAGTATGSGFVVRADRTTAYVVTNDHVIDHTDAFPGGAGGMAAPRIEVVFDSGTPAERTAVATVAAADPDTDLAVLQVSGVKDLPAPLDLADPPKLMETLPVLVCGFPFGQRNIDIGQASVSSIRTDPAGRVLYVQLTGALNPGNSGGPILTADGKLVGVAVMTIRGAGKGLAIPSAQVTQMLKGRAGAVRLVPADEGMGRLEVDVIDPLRAVKSVAAYYKQAGGAVPAVKPDAPTVMPGATRVPLAVAGGKATAELKLPAGKRPELFVQVEVERADGTALTEPGTVALSNPLDRGPGMPTRAPRIRLPSGQVLPPPTFRRPPGSDDDTLSEVIRKPAAFVGKAVEFDALSSCAVIPQGDKYELVIETDAERAPTNLRPIVPKDLALQLSDLGLADPIKFAVRVKGTVEKPLGRDDRHVIEVREVGFLDESGKVATSLKPEAYAPPGKPTLSTLNRFPEKYVGQLLAVDGWVNGARFAGRGLPLDVANENGAAPLNLEFYASKELHNQLAAEIPNGGANAKLTLTVDRVDAKTGHGIVGVSKVELPGGKPKTFSSSEKVSYPAATPAGKPKGAAGDKTAAAPPAAATAKGPDPPAAKGGGDTLLYAAIGAAVLAGLGGVGVVALLLRWRKTPAARREPAGAAEPAEAPQSRPKPARPPARPGRKPAGGRGGQDEFPGFDFENR